MAMVLPSGELAVLLVGNEVRIAALGMVSLQRDFGGASDLVLAAEAEALKRQLKSAIESAGDAMVRHSFDGTCVTTGPLNHDLSEPDACRSLGISRSTFGRRARRLGLVPAERGRGRPNVWRAVDVAAIGRA